MYKHVRHCIFIIGLNVTQQTHGLLNFTLKEPNKSFLNLPAGLSQINSFMRYGNIYAGKTNSI